jgi:hypothetical protein
MEKTSRTPRDLETREATQRKAQWRPPSLLPVPLKRPGLSHRWIRVSTFGETDVKNVSQRFRENWAPVKRSDYPELNVISDKDSKWPDGVEVGGLILCVTAEENTSARKQYFENMSRNQLQAMDAQTFAASDPRMPLHAPERRTHVQRGIPREFETQETGE